MKGRAGQKSIATLSHSNETLVALAGLATWFWFLMLASERALSFNLALVELASFSRVASSSQPTLAAAAAGERLSSRGDHMILDGSAVSPKHDDDDYNKQNGYLLAPVYVAITFASGAVVHDEQDDDDDEPQSFS